MSDHHFIKISKHLSWLLRHHVVDHGLKITDDGYVLWDDIVKIQQFSTYTLDDVKHVVDTNDKKRFSLKEENGKCYIRANQGHSHEVASKIKQEELLTKLDSPLDLIVHGTTYQAYKEIKLSGLKKMGRSHIHFAINDDIVKGNQQQSGIRGNCKVLIFVNMKQAMDDGIEFYMSENKVVLSPGIGDEGLIDRKYFSKIVDRYTGNIIN